jgi:hypothetical protein
MWKKVKVEEVEETVGTLVEQTTVKVEKPKWSLKKKLIVAGAAVVGLILGAVALSIKKAPNAGEGQDGIDGAEEDELAALEAGENTFEVTAIDGDGQSHVIYP